MFSIILFLHSHYISKYVFRADNEGKLSILKFVQCAFVPSLSLHKQMCGARCYLISSWWWLATINFVNVSPLLPSPCIQISNPDDPLIYARLHQHRQLVDQIFIDFSTDFTSSTSSLARHVAGLGFFLCWLCHYKFVQIFSLNVKYFLSTKPFKASLLRRFVNNVLHSSSLQGCLLIYLRVSVSLWTPSRILLLSDQPCTKFGRTVLNSDPNW